MPPIRTRESKNAAQEQKIQRALEERQLEGTSFRNLALKYGVTSSTLSDRVWSGLTRQEGHAHRQRLTPAMEKALTDWCQELDDCGFPPRLDLLRAMAGALAQLRAEEENDPELAYLGKHWLSSFLDRHPALASKYGTQLDPQRAYTSNLPSLRDYFKRLMKLMRKHHLKPEDIFNMDEKGFVIGMSAKAKVICRAGRRPPRVTQDGTREMLTIIECVCAALYMLPSFTIFKGKAHYMGWHTETNDPDAVFAYSPNGWTDDELGLKWLHHFDSCTKDWQNGNGCPCLLILDGHRSNIPSNSVNIAFTTTSYFAVALPMLRTCFSLLTLVSLHRCKSITVKLQTITSEKLAPQSSRELSGSSTALLIDLHTPKRISSPHGGRPESTP